MADVPCMPLTDDATSSGAGLSDGDEDSIMLNTRGAEDIFVLVDDGAGGDHAGYELLVEIQTQNGMKEYTRLGGASSPETARSWDLPAIGFEMKLTLINQSGGTADHSLDAFAEGK